jgi:cytochrome oxidase Cu insertion factor (SCO1/SenC/PrrC family)
VKSIAHFATMAVLMLGMLTGAGLIATSQESSSPQRPKLGEVAPDFTLPNIEGKKVSLKDFRAKKQVLLVFYPALFRAGG